MSLNYPLDIGKKNVGTYLCLYPVLEENWVLFTGPLRQKEDMKLVLHLHSTFLKVSPDLIFIHLKEKSDQGCFLLPEVLPASKASWSHFCGPTSEEKEERETRANLKYKFCVSQPVLLSAVFPHNSGLCWLCFINNRNSQYWYFQFLSWFVSVERKTKQRMSKEQKPPAPFPDMAQTCACGA